MRKSSFLLLTFSVICGLSQLSAQENAYKIIAPSGQVVTVVEYDDMDYFYEGLARVRLNNKSAYIDINGKVIIPTNKDFYFDEASYFTPSGLAKVKVGGFYGFIDKQGKEQIPFRFEEVADFYGALAVAKKEGNWGAIDKTGNWIIPPNYVAVENGSGVIIVYDGSLFALFSEKGENLTGFVYENIGIQLGTISEGLIPVRKGDKWGFMNEKGVLQVPLTYEEVGRFSEGLCGVVLNGKIGYINTQGKAVTEFIFDASDEFSEGLAAVKKGNLWGYIDKTGKTIIPFEYDAAYKFSEGVASVEKKGKSLMIDKQNKESQSTSQGVTTSTNAYSYEEVKIGESYTMDYPKYGLRVEKHYEGNGNAKNCVITEMTTGKILGENVQIHAGKITEGTFYYEDKKFIINKLNTNLANLKSEVAAFAQKPVASTTVSMDNQTLVRLLKEIQAMNEKLDDMDRQYFFISLEFDIDASTEEEAKANLKKKLQPYSEVVAEFNEKCKLVLSNSTALKPETVAALESMMKKHTDNEIRCLSH